jgi:hypothetical protein
MMRITPKQLWLAGGAAAGFGAGKAAQSFMISDKESAALEAKGVNAMSGRQAIALGAPAAFFFAAAIGAGLSKRHEQAALTTATLGAAAMLASTGASTMVNARDEKVDDYLNTITALGIIGSVGFGIGARPKFNETAVKYAALGSLGLAAGGLAAETGPWMLSIPSQVINGFRYSGEPSPE